MKISEMNKITRHYDKYFQQTDAIVIHPNFEAKLHVDALLYQPTKTFPFWKLATMGASDYAMLGRHTLGNRNEYMLFIDPSVDMTDKEVASKYFEILFRTAMFPIENNCLISFGHSLEFGDKVDGSVVGVFLDLPQAIDDLKFLFCKLSPFKKTVCLQAIPLDMQALNQLLTVGNEEFSYTYAYPENDDEPHGLFKL